MDAVLLARIQFALTIMFHYIFPPITIGLAWMIFMYNSRALKGSAIHRQLAYFWTKVFAVSFAIGVATGITMEFQFGTNWANYSRFVGDIFGAPLAAEGVFAFFLESSFLGILLYGRKKVSDKVYCFSSLMVAVGATLSAFWIVVANSWQQTPAGYKLVTENINGIEVQRAVLTDFWAAVFNPSTLPRYTHTIAGALVAGTFFSFHFMLYLGGWFALVSVSGLFLWWRKKLDNKLFLLMAAVTLPLPIICNELGWMAAEIGRQPWTVYGLQRTSEAASNAQTVPAGQILASIIMFSLIYSLLFGLWIYLLKKTFAKGPEPVEMLEEGN